ncbi:Alpha/Beta hydrolase protein [Kalaharituber pfeilii]|nr:Alpha/Beta hydrolase protein [Kalaharituber pfeilii]
MSLALLRTVLPKVPHILSSCASHILSLNPHSKEWDFRTFLTVTVLQAFLGVTENRDVYGNVMTVEKVQRMSNTERELENDCWVSKVVIPLDTHEEEVRQLEEIIDRAIRELAGRDDMVVDGAKVPKTGLTGEWTGWRNVNKRGKYTRPWNSDEKLDERQNYKNLMEDISAFKDPRGEDGVLLWLHGGAYFFCDPCTHRPIGKNMSKQFGGPILLPRYRLAPQHPFPAALVDTFLSYLYLLYPPAGSYHQAYTSNQIFVGGDSAGGGLALCLMQLLLWFNTPNEDGSKKTIRWRGQDREVPLPKGVTIISAWVDLARCFVELTADGKGGTSENSCAGGDFIPAPARAMEVTYAQSPAWPADPPRTHFYANNTAITHPLVSPMAAKSWKGCPPVWLCVGDECLRDSNLYWAHRLLQAQVPIQMEMYTMMPHVFALLLHHHPCTVRAYNGVGNFLKYNLSKEPAEEYSYKRVRIHPRTLKETPVDESCLSLGGLELEEVIALMEKEVKKWQRKVRKPTDYEVGSGDALGGLDATAAA